MTNIQLLDRSFTTSLLKPNIRRRLSILHTARLILAGCATIVLVYIYREFTTLVLDLRYTAAAESLGATSGTFLPQFKNPCFLEIHEKDILGPFHTQRSRSRLSYSRRAVHVRYTDTKHQVLHCLPYYFVLGWAKCGTTALAYKMQAHPDILQPALKEPAFFSSRRFEDNPTKNDYHLKQAVDYIDFFDNNAHQIALHYYHSAQQQVPLIVGDHSTHTIDQWHAYVNNKSQHYTRKPPASQTDAIFTSSTAQFIRRILPESRFIILLRDPVDRLYSLYKMHSAESPQDFHEGVVSGIAAWQECTARATATPAFDDCRYAVKKQHQGSVWTRRAAEDIAKSMYYYFIAEWLEVFPKHQFLFITYNDIITNVEDVITERVFPFLGVRRLTGAEQWWMRAWSKTHVVRNRPRADGRWVNQSYKEPMLNETRKLLKQFFYPYNQLLNSLIGNELYNSKYGMTSII